MDKPAFTLRDAARRWRTFARHAARVQSHVILGAFYVVLLVPLGWMRRAFADPLRSRSHDATWLAREPRQRTIEAARKQF